MVISPDRTIFWLKESNLCIRKSRRNPQVPSVHQDHRFAIFARRNRERQFDNIGWSGLLPIRLHAAAPIFLDTNLGLNRV